MGADIHLWAERRQKGTNRWETFGELELDRNYEVFGVLANVRGLGAIYEPRGFPDNASWGAADDYEKWGPDAHTPSWLTFAELTQALSFVKPPSSYYALIAALAALEANGDETRVVFWFDN